MPTPTNLLEISSDVVRLQNDINLCVIRINAAITELTPLISDPDYTTYINVSQIVTKLTACLVPLNVALAALVNGR